MSAESRLHIARALREIALYLRLTNESSFKVKAYERAAYALEHGKHDLDALVAGGGLTSIAGIGSRLAATIEEIYRSGTSRLLDRLRSQFPPGTMEMIDIPHLGLKKIAALHTALGITTREELKQACEAGRLRKVPGFGARTEQKILAALAAPASHERGHLLVHALAAAEPLLAYLRACTFVKRVDIAGEMRRSCELVDQLELVAAATNIEGALDHYVRYPGSVATVSRAKQEAVVRLLTGPTVLLHVVPTSAYVTARHFFTGAPEHIAKLTQRAEKSGMTLEASALRGANGTRIRVGSEAEIYRQLKLQPIAPELREDTGEVEAAAQGSLPAPLVQIDDIKGMTHVHTLYSDGRESIEVMARAAEALGMKYLTITDHSPSAAYAGGVTHDQLQRQWEEIDRVQERVGIRLLRGTESDILRDGSLDYPDALLEKFDVIIASIHSRHHLSPREMTRRIVRAMRAPVFKIWGHPLGRLVNRRPPIECDVEHILDTIAASQAAVEINGDPHRLDLEPRWIRAARQRGLKFIISTDAHSTGNLLNLRFGIAMARRGWVTRSEVLNALPVARFCAAVRPVQTS